MECYFYTHGKTCRFDHTSATCNFPKTGHQVGSTLGNNTGGSEKWCKEDKANEYDGGAINTVVEKMNYNHHLSLIQTLPNSITRSPPQPHANDPIADSICRGKYLDSLTKIFHTREPSENPINVKLPNSSKMASTHQAQIPLKNYQFKQKIKKCFPSSTPVSSQLDKFVMMNV